MKTMTRNQTGQVILILLLVMAVSLAIALSIVQRSLTDLSSSTKIEESSRALSAAEAGIEKILQSGGSETTTISLAESNASAYVRNYGPIPAQHTALEYPALAKEEVAHVWLADPDSNSVDGSPNPYYTQTQLGIFWGNIPPAPSSDLPAIEINLFYLDNQAIPLYQVRKYLIDSQAGVRNNGFLLPGDSQFLAGSGCIPDGYSIPTSFGTVRKFYCQVTLTGLSSINAADFPTGLSKLIALRVRLLYNPVSEAFAVNPLGSCGLNCSLPPQAELFISTGLSGDTQRRVQLFQLNKVVPFYLDFAIFAAGNVAK